MSLNRWDHECRRSSKCKPFGKYGPGWKDTIDCAKQAAWNKKMAALLAKDPKPYRPTMPKGEVT